MTEYKSIINLSVETAAKGEREVVWGMFEAFAQKLWDDGLITDMGLSANDTEVYELDLGLKKERPPSPGSSNAFGRYQRGET